MVSVGDVVTIAQNSTVVCPGIVTVVNADGTVKVFPLAHDGAVTLPYSEVEPSAVPNDDKLYAFSQVSVSPALAPVPSVDPNLTQTLPVQS